MPSGRSSSPPWSRSPSRLRSARLATRMGVVHHPRERDLHERPVPGLGGLAILAAVLVAALFFMPAGAQTRGIIGGAIAITLVGAIDDIRPGGLHPALKLVGQFAAAAIPVFADVRVENLTLPFIDPISPRRLGLPADAGRDRRRDEHRQLHRRRRRPRRGRLHDRGSHLRDHRAVVLGTPDAAHPRRAHGRRRDRLPVAQLPPGVDLHGRRGLEPARPAARLRGDPGRAEDGRRRRALLPAADPRRAGARRHLRRRQADQVPPARLRGGPLALPPPLREHRLLAAAHRPLPVRLDAVARGARAGDALRSRTRTTTARSTPAGRS